MFSQKVKRKLVLRVHQKGSSFLRADREERGYLVWVILGDYSGSEKQWNILIYNCEGQRGCWEERGSQHPGKKGTGESFSLTLAKQSQESRQRESAGLAASKRSCIDF